MRKFCVFIFFKDLVGKMQLKMYSFFFFFIG